MAGRRRVLSGNQCYQARTIIFMINQKLREIKITERPVALAKAARMGGVSGRRFRQMLSRLDVLALKIRGRVVVPPCELKRVLCRHRAR